jgi:hypothetical protein
MKTFDQCCKEVSIEHGLGTSLVTGHAAKYWKQAAELYAQEVAKDAWKQFEARPIDTKSGWKHNSKILQEIVTAINEETYIEDENEMMEIIDHALTVIENKCKPPYQPNQEKP